MININGQHFLSCIVYRLYVIIHKLGTVKKGKRFSEKKISSLLLISNIVLYLNVHEHGRKLRHAKLYSLAYT